MNENVGSFAPGSLVPVDQYFQWLNDKEKTIKQENKMTLQDELQAYLTRKSYGVSTVARRGKISTNTVKRALLGAPITPANAGIIMKVIGKSGLEYTRSKHNVLKKHRKYRHKRKSGNGLVKTHEIAAPFGLKYTTVKISGGRSLLVNLNTGKTQLLEV